MGQGAEVGLSRSWPLTCRGCRTRCRGTPVAKSEGRCPAAAHGSSPTRSCRAALRYPQLPDCRPDRLDLGGDAGTRALARRACLCIVASGIDSVQVAEPPDLAHPDLLERDGRLPDVGAGSRRPLDPGPIPLTLGDPGPEAGSPESEPPTGAGPCKGQPQSHRHPSRHRIAYATGPVPGSRTIIDVSPALTRE